MTLSSSTQFVPLAEVGTSCELRDGCITCGDVAVPLSVVEVTGDDALCRDDQGRTELVATELVGVVATGDRLLVHAGVAIELLSPPTESVT